MTLTELAWAAGLFEGKGTVRINKATKRNLGALVVSVVNTDLDIVLFFQSRWPGYMKAATGLRVDQRPAFVWVIAARKAAPFLDAIAPFVQTKRMDARITAAIDFQRSKSTSPRVTSTDEYREAQFNSYLWIRELNARGVGTR